MGQYNNTVLAVTFSRDAAHEMKSRINELMGQTCRNIVNGTFHALALKQLKRHGFNTHLISNFEKKSYIKSAMDHVGMQGKIDDDMRIVNLINP